MRVAAASRRETRSPARAWSTRRRRPALAPPGRPPAARAPPPCSPAALLVYPHVVHAHGLREDSGRIRTAGPIPSHRNVENDEKRMVVHPASRKTFGGDSQVEGIVDVPANRILLPLDGVHVKGVGERARAHVICAADALRTGVPGAVHRAVHPAGLLADVLHDVDLAARGPADRGDVVAQHPERGPQPLTARYLNTGLDATVLPRAQALGLEPGRRVFAVRERLVTGLDDEVARVDVRVLDAVGVELGGGGPPNNNPRLPHPPRGVEGLAVELVVPHACPARIPARLRGEAPNRRHA